MKKMTLALLSLSIATAKQLIAQEILPATFPVNGILDKRPSLYAFTNATIVVDASHKLEKAILLINEGKILSVSTNATIPLGAVVVDCKGKFIYPSFIDLYANYGIDGKPIVGRPDYREPTQIESNIKGAFGWNQAIHADVDAASLFVTKPVDAEKFRKVGFGTLLTHKDDGIVQGTGAVVLLSNEKANFTVLKKNASTHYSFKKGSSTQSYPSSMMGSIALLRQTYLDALWYKNNTKGEGLNLSLQAFNNGLALPQIFDAGDKWNDLRADRIGDEFGYQYIIKAGGNEYQRLKEIKATNAAYILNLDYPKPMDVDDPEKAKDVALADLKHWELAPQQPALFEQNHIPFVFTSFDNKNIEDFTANIRKSIAFGLSDTAALNALTKQPAQLLKIYDEVGSLTVGKLANFLVTSGPIFNENTVILQNWVKGDKYEVNGDNSNMIAGNYNLSIDNQLYNLSVQDANTAKLIKGTDSLPAKIQFDGTFVRLSFPLQKGGSSVYLNGTVWKDSIQGSGTDSLGNPILWTAIKMNALTQKDKELASKKPLSLGKITYPLNGYGWDSLPKEETILFKNATVWTNEKDGILPNTDVLVKGGKIAAIGKNLSSSGAKAIDATGKYLTPGIIDEHSHIATSSINEGGQSVTSEVRIGDNLNPDDIYIYYQLAGGVTTSHILHGSANTIGGQNQIIKLRWGKDDEEIKYKEAPRFIKFALGENVKRTRLSNNNRFPNTRMGVEQTLADAFQRAKDYQTALAGPNAAKQRRDLELDALVDIMNNKLFITSHSYVQSELMAAMKVSEKYGFHYNTFTHVLEGYKVADTFKTYGVNVATFSDWWAYKTEVKDAIAYNAAIMSKVGLNVSINSDDAEQARRLNQEAAKVVKYGGISEEEAFKMVTLNPAKALHIDNLTGSVKVGKSADLVLWNNHPLSVYATPEETMVDGIIYFDKERDKQLRQYIRTERKRLIDKMIAEKKLGVTVVPAHRPKPISEDEDLD